MRLTAGRAGEGSGWRGCGGGGVETGCGNLGRAGKMRLYLCTRFQGCRKLSS